MRVLHTYCLNYNIGDYALGIGVKNILRKYFDIDFIAETNIQGRHFTQYYIDEVVNKRYDLLVIGGGGIIHGAHWPNGWFWLIQKELIQEIKIPFIVYGAGNNYWDDKEQIPPIGIEHLKETFRLSRYFSVRNDGSFTRLKLQSGIEARVIPDPGFHVNLCKDSDSPINERFVVIQLANDKPEYRFGSTIDQIEFIRHLREVVRELIKQYHVVMAPHVFDDIVLSRKVIDGIPNTSLWDFSYFAFDHVADSFRYYKNAEFVIAMRGHGQIIPISFNTPVISLTNHPKHKGLMNELGLNLYNISLSDRDLSEKLLKLIKEIETNKDNLFVQYKAINKKLENQTEEEFLFIKASIL